METPNSGTALDHGQIRLAAGGDDDDVGRFRHHLFGRRLVAEAPLDTEPGHLAIEPARDAREILAPAGLGGDVDLAAAALIFLEQHHLVAALGRYAGGFEARAGPAPTTTTLRFGPEDLAMIWGMVASRPVAGFWMHSASPPT